uniref:LIM domain 7a n=1 Tax=Mastacembelus armatus TaxID=205130 RepID=A0A7N8YJM7_9TELE
LSWNDGTNYLGMMDIWSLGHLRLYRAVTKKKFGSNDFRSALENGVLLCDLINRIKPGIIKRVNRLPTPIAGLDNLNVFLKACGKLGLKEAQLFHPGDLQDLSTRVTVKDQETNRRLKNVLITIFWLGRRAECDCFYDGPYLNFKAFEGLLGTALYKALQESSSQKGSSVRDSGFGDSWYSEREELHQLRVEGGGEHRRDDSLDSLDSFNSRPHSISSDTTLKGNSEGCCSDTEADSFFRMADNKDSLSYRRSTVITPRTSNQFNQFLPTRDKPSGYVPAPLRKRRTERNDDNRRSWTDSTYTEDECTLTRYSYRTHLSDLLLVQDLNKWKSRRRSVNSDIVKKKEEREKIEQATYSSDKKSKTFKEMQEERENKGQNKTGNRLDSFSFTGDDEDVFEMPVVYPRTRSLPARSYTIDTPYSSSEPSVPSLKEDEPPTASPATGRAAFPPTSQKVDIVDSSSSTPSITRSSRSSLHSSQPPATAPLKRNPVSEHTSTAKTEEATTITSTSSFPQKVSELRRPLSGTQTEVNAPSSGSLYKPQPQLSSMEPKPPGVSRVSSSLPRSYQKSDSARLSSVVTPRPFGTQPSRISSLPRASTMDESQKRVNGDVSVSKKSSVPSRYHQFMTSEDEAQSSSAHSSEDGDEQQTAPKSITSTQSVSPTPRPVKSEALNSSVPAKVTSQVHENYCEMRINLNQKPNSSRDFGFQSAWDSTGVRVTSIQPGSPAEMCQLQAGDKVLTVNGHKVAEMSYTDWKSHMEEALQEGSLVMDIRRHGKNNWDRDQTSLPFKSHKTINLTSTDHPILLGSPDTNIATSSLDFTSRISTEKLPTKESESISLKNLKRRSEFFERGKINDLQQFVQLYKHVHILHNSFLCLQIPVPSITSSSSRWSWDPEEERKRQEKWQKEQERLLQRKRKEEQERQRQVEERRKREEEERELQRLQEERKRKEKEEEERKSREEELKRQKEREEELKRQREREEELKRQREREEELKRQREREEELKWQKEREEELKRQREREQELKRQKEREQELKWQREREEERRLTGSGLGEKTGQQSTSQAELERQHILNEMKKKTSLLTDNSWIRQRSANTTTSKDSDVPPMRRGESLDNLDASHNSWRSSWTPRSNSFAQSYIRPHSALSGSTSFYSSGSGAQRPGSSTLPSSYSLGSLRGGAGTPSSVSGKKICTFCDAPLGKGAAMIIESLGLCYHLSCFKCIDCKSDLGGSEAGAEVRIRNKQLYCNSCYVRFKTGQPTAM